jgi:predicted metal-dependent hydrolase
MIPLLIRKVRKKVIDVEVKDFGVKKMKQNGGTCNIDAQRIWLNLELAKKPSNCLEYYILMFTEMTHLLDVITILDLLVCESNMPNWKRVREVE